jgi:AmmeMemoRadiSam system protein B
MATVRPPAVAGFFYPDDPRELRETIDRWLGEASSTGPSPKAVIAPHAGYVYSGPIAARAYARLAAAREEIRRVVLLGPAHRAGFQGIACPRAEAFQTPLGLVPVDRDALDGIFEFPQIGYLESAWEGEHSLEVHLPFLQVALGEFALVPLLVGAAEPEEVDDVLERLWGGQETRFVVSSDLSHYHDYETARTLDRATTQAIEDLRYEDLGAGDACGFHPLRGLLRAARRHALQVETLDLRNSGDTAGSRDQVVGYGSYAFC